MKSLLLCLLLGVAISTPAGNFYLVSKERERNLKHPVGPPLPFNPYKDAPRYRVVDDIWLVDDSAFVLATTNQQCIEEIGYLLAARIQKNREAAARFALTNPPVPVVVFPQLPPFTNWYNKTDTNLGLAIRLMEKMSPGVSTNFTPEQLRIAPNDTNVGRPVEGLQRLPDHINIYSPTFKEDLKKWKEEHMIEKVPSPRSSGGGDYDFDETAYYHLSVQPMPAPTAQDYPLF